MRVIHIIKGQATAPFFERGQILDQKIKNYRRKKMTINDLLSKKKENVIEKSFNLTISTYPEDSQAFFKEKKKTVYKSCRLYYLSRD